MCKTIILMSGTVLIINLIYLILPKGEYEKYCKFILGLVFMLVFVGSFADFELSSEILNPNLSVQTFNNDKIKKVIDEQTQKIVEEKIKHHLENNDITVSAINVHINNNKILKVSVISNNNVELVTELISDFCDIDKEIIFIEQVK